LCKTAKVGFENLKNKIPRKRYNKQNHPPSVYKISKNKKKSQTTKSTIQNWKEIFVSRNLFSFWRILFSRILDGNDMHGYFKKKNICLAIKIG